MKKMVIILMISVMIVFSTCYADEISKFEGPGFDTPEEAVTAYIEAWKVGDIQKMLSIFAIESYVDNVNRNYEYQRITSWSVYSMPGLPVTSIRARGVDIARRYSLLGQSFYIQYAFWIWPEELGEFGNAITGFYDTESTQSILDALSAENRIASLGDIELIDFISPCEIDEYFVSENYEVRKMAFLRGSGAEDMQDTVADIILDGNHYYYAPSTVKYGGRWYLYNNMGLVANYLGANPYSWLVQIE